MATYWENSCSFGLRFVSWYMYLIVSLVFSHLGFWSGNLFLIAPFPDLCLLVPFHPRVLKELAMELGPVFYHLFQQSIDTGEISKEWSLANILPLFKKGDRSLARNCHPVSLTCIPCKLLEHTVCSNIMAYLDEHELLSDRQHAFRKWHSCETQLTIIR